ncbi:hypothetical protein ACFVZC_15355 [Streptomyces marokkonensis]|uniref:Uncharacterized protein n=1 Tax=Streptomyces marokkonensis TaxID=324855 RepID=A0ABW6Q6E3_9ACTN
MNEAAYTLEQLRAPRPAVRADVPASRTAPSGTSPAHRSRGGIPRLVVFPDGHGDARTERTGLREPARHRLLPRLVLHDWVVETLDRVRRG